MTATIAHTTIVGGTRGSEQTAVRRRWSPAARVTAAARAIACARVVGERHWPTRRRPRPVGALASPC
jgi:hypothetical protein